jgi:hypothetical protein
MCSEWTVKFTKSASSPNVNYAVVYKAHYPTMVMQECLWVEIAPEMSVMMRKKTAYFIQFNYSYEVIKGLTFVSAT